MEPNMSMLKLSMKVVEEAKVVVGKRRHPKLLLETQKPHQ